MEPEEDKATCLSIAQQIERDVQGARKHRIFNTGIFLVLGCIGIVNLCFIIGNRKAIQQDYNLSVSNAGNIAQVKAKQDLYRQQYLDYIKDTVEFMQQLQDDNSDPEKLKRRGVKVPKAPVPRSIPNGNLTVEDLQRIPQTKVLPTPTPIVKTIVKTKVKKVRVSPTPGPLERLFKPKATR